MARPPSDLPADFTKAAFTVRQGREAGLSAKRLRGKDLDRPFHGVRSVAGALTPEDTPDRYEYAAAVLAQRCDALELVLSEDAFFSHLTAARLWPLPLPEPAEDEPVHVGVLMGGQPPHRRGVVGHHISDPNVHVVRRLGRRTVDPASLFCQLGRMLHTDDLVAVGDALVLAPRFEDADCDRPWATIDQLTERVELFRGRGKANAAAALAQVRPGAESRRESQLRVAVVRAGLPEPEVNVDIFSADGMFLGRGDLVYRKWRVIGEYDGDLHRSDSGQYEKDVGRLEGFGADGWRVVRVTGPAFSSDRQACVARIERALRAAGWRP